MTAALTGGLAFGALAMPHREAATARMWQVSGKLFRHTRGLGRPGMEQQGPVICEVQQQYGFRMEEQQRDGSQGVVG